MGSNYKSYGGKCGCSKKLKKAQRVPQRGPGVAELEKILSDQKHDQMKPIYAPPGTPMYHHQAQLRAGQHQQIMFPPPPPLPPLSALHFPQSQLFGNNQYVKAWNQNCGAMRSDSAIARPELGMSYTQMMMMGDRDHHESKPNANHMFQPNMNYHYPSAAVPHPMPPAADSGLNHFNEHSSSQRFYSKCAATWPEDDKHALKRPRVEMPSHPHPFYAQQQERMMLRNILTLGPPSPTIGSSPQPMNPIFVESDSSEDQYKDSNSNNSSDKSHKIQIFGFNLKDEGQSMDDTKLSLHHNAAQAEEHSLDLNLKL